MIATHLCRWGMLGHVAAFSAVDAVRYPRGSRVVLRTGRGLELGEVLTPFDSTSQDRAASAPHAGQILRGMSEQDQLLETRLLKRRREAFDACHRKLAELGIDAALVDVEHLFDGRSLVFHFLGDPPPEMNQVTDELAATYDAQVQFKAFTDAVETGCGPGCGTEDAPGCKTCVSGCAVAEFCSSHKHAS